MGCRRNRGSHHNCYDLIISDVDHQRSSQSESSPRPESQYAEPQARYCRRWRHDSGQSAEQRVQRHGYRLAIDHRCPARAEPTDIKRVDVRIHLSDDSTVVVDNIPFCYVGMWSSATDANLVALQHMPRFGEGRGFGLLPWCRSLDQGHKSLLTSLILSRKVFNLIRFVFYLDVQKGPVLMYSDAMLCTFKLNSSCNGLHDNKNNFMPEIFFKYLLVHW